MYILLSSKKIVKHINFYYPFQRWDQEDPPTLPESQNRMYTIISNTSFTSFLSHSYFSTFNSKYSVEYGSMPDYTPVLPRICKDISLELLEYRDFKIFFNFFLVTIKIAQRQQPKTTTYQ